MVHRTVYVLLIIDKIFNFILLAVHLYREAFGLCIPSYRYPIRGWRDSITALRGC